jgi:AcrR family transcriptional regulator
MRASVTTASPPRSSRSASGRGAPEDPRRVPRQDRSRQTVEAIVEAAARVLERQGYQRSTTNAIARLAGVSVGSVYQYFPNKAALVTALHERHVAQVGAIVERTLEEGEGRSLRETIERLVDAVLSAHRREPRLQRILHAELVALERPASESASGAALLERTRAWLEQHRAHIAQRDLDAAARVLIVTVESLVHEAVLGERPLDREICDVVEGYLGLR